MKVSHVLNNLQTLSSWGPGKFTGSKVNVEDGFFLASCEDKSRDARLAESKDLRGFFDEQIDL